MTSMLSHSFKSFFYKHQLEKCPTERPNFFLYGFSYQCIMGIPNTILFSSYSWLLSKPHMIVVKGIYTFWSSPFPLSHQYYNINIVGAWISSVTEREEKGKKSKGGTVVSINKRLFLLEGNDSVESCLLAHRNDPLYFTFCMAPMLDGLNRQSGGLLWLASNRCIGWFLSSNCWCWIGLDGPGPWSLDQSPYCLLSFSLQKLDPSRPLDRTLFFFLWN